MSAWCSRSCGNICPLPNSFDRSADAPHGLLAASVLLEDAGGSENSGCAVIVGVRGRHPTPEHVDECGQHPGRIGKFAYHGRGGRSRRWQFEPGHRTSVSIAPGMATASVGTFEHADFGWVTESVIRRSVPPP